MWFRRRPRTARQRRPQAESRRSRRLDPLEVCSAIGNLPLRGVRHNGTCSECQAKRSARTSLWAPRWPLACHSRWRLVSKDLVYGLWRDETCAVLEERWARAALEEVRGWERVSTEGEAAALAREPHLLWSPIGEPEEY